MAAQFPNEELVACAKREVAMRENCYPRWDKKEHISECSEARQKEYYMMQAITDQLIALPELLARYQKAKDVVRDLLPQAITFNSPKEGTLVLVYCDNSERPYLARRIDLNKWDFEDNYGSIMENGIDSQHVYAFSYLPSRPKQ